MKIAKWNYRVVERHMNGDPKSSKWLAIHEVYYDEDGKVQGIASNPCDVRATDGESIESIRKTLNMMLDATVKPVVKYHTLCEVHETQTDS